METPAKSVASAATMIAAKRAVMIDDLTRAITDLADNDQPAYEVGPLTCSTCRVTYLPSAIPAGSTSSEAWVCDSCQPRLG